MTASTKSQRRSLSMLTTGSVLLTILAAHAAPAAGWNSDRKWSIRKVHYRINPSNGDMTNNQAIKALRWSADQWTQQSEAGFRFIYDGTSSISINDGNDNVNVVLFRNAYKPGSTTARATAYTYYNPATPDVILGFDIVFWEKAATFVPASASCANQVVLENTAIHEFGHALGLKHVSLTGATMYGFSSTCATGRMTLHADDIAGVEALYPCTANWQCGDGLVCTTDVCQGSLCIRSSIPGCCTANSQCGDSDACTADSCVNNQCVNSPIGNCSTVGQTQTQACGDCGTRTRTCTSGCTWSAWSACTGQGVCGAGDTQSQTCGNCGTRSRTCTNSCSWGGWSACTGQGCSPGDTQTEACGNCGTRSRTCSSSCEWEPWSACTGQGACAAGDTQTRDCCDCGSQQRTCTSSCEWEPWSDCAGPDPAVDTGCETGVPGVCAGGQPRCVQGCLTCVPRTEPTAELCDGLDNDCDGAVDEEQPAVMGSPPPSYAARLLDWSAPTSLPPGEPGQGWARFENVGQQAWPAGAIRLSALVTADATASLLHDSETWSVDQTLAANWEEVPAGGVTELQFTIRLDPQVTDQRTESFQLLTPDGAPMQCPSPGFTLTVHRTAPSGPDGHVDGEDPAASLKVTGGCHSAGTAGGSAPLLLLLLLSWLRRRR